MKEYRNMNYSVIYKITINNSSVKNYFKIPVLVLVPVQYFSGFRPDFEKNNLAEIPVHPYYLIQRFLLKYIINYNFMNF